MRLFRKKKKEVIIEESDSDDITSGGDEKTLIWDIKDSKRKSYSISGVDETHFNKQRIKEKIERERLIRATGYLCPKCKNILFNTRVDGIHYYCPNCEKQFKISKK